MRVRLEVDLTRYHPSLVRGLEGETIGMFGEWSRGSDRFVGVRFPEKTLDVLWESLRAVEEKAS